MFHLWTGLARYVTMHEIEVLFGVASLPGTDLEALSGPLSLLHHDHLAAPAMRPRSLNFERMDRLTREQLNRRDALIAMPSLIKAYLRLGMVGERAFVDHAFNCTDVCMIMDTQKLNARHANRYTQAHA